jgi:hypothetical protein
MKKTFFSLAVAVLLSAAATTSASAQAAMTPGTVMVGGMAMYPNKDIVSNAVNSKDHTTLVAAVKAAGLVETLQGKGPFTVFAPVNDAFENLPAGTRLAIGSAIVEVTKQPHNGCKKFVERFGLDAMKFVNSPVGKQYHLRGIYARVVQSGTIRRGAAVKKI